MLDLQDQITLKMTREEAAALVVAASMSEELPASLEVLVNRAVGIVQRSGAPIGTISRVVADHAVRPR